MKIIDYKKCLKHLYSPPASKITIIDVPRMNYLMIDGKGNPNTSKEFKDAVETLYPVSYALKFMMKKGKKQIDYKVAPLEGLWWVPDMRKFSAEHKDDWLWTMMVMQPDFITAKEAEDAIEIVLKKKNPPALEKVRFCPYSEGICAQILYTGAYKDEGPAIARIHEFIRQSGYRVEGKHHEIYLSDMRRTAPEKLKTIIRQPMVK